MSVVSVLVDVCVCSGGGGVDRVCLFCLGGSVKRKLKFSGDGLYVLLGWLLFVVVVVVVVLCKKVKKYICSEK